MAAAVRSAGGFSADAARPLFDLEERAGLFPAFDTADGQRFIVVRTLEPPRDAVVVVQNWLREFIR